MFDEFDDDGSGFIDFEEFRCLLAACAAGVSDSQSELIWSIVDGGENGVITFKEFTDFLNMQVGWYDLV